MQAAASQRAGAHAAAGTSPRVLAPRSALASPGRPHAGASSPARPIAPCLQCSLLRAQRQQQSRPSLRARASGDDSEPPTQYNKEFGYSRKDVLLIGVGIIALGYAMYYGAQAAGIEATAAGNYVQLFIFLVICVGYVSTYIFRVANKDMTYARQLEAYEEMVMQKRLDEMPATERERLLAEVESERERRANRAPRQ